MITGKDEQFAYKRALSRLLEMTSSSYAAEELWTPLPASVRKWEGANTLPTGAKAVSSTVMGALQREREEGGDFAAEAAYSGSTSTPFRTRPEAPRIREHHMWGVGGFDMPEEAEGVDVKSSKSRDNKK